MGLVIPGVFLVAQAPSLLLCGVQDSSPKISETGNNLRRQSSRLGETPVLVDRNRPQTQNGSRAWELFSSGARGISRWRTLFRVLRPVVARACWSRLHAVGMWCPATTQATKTPRNASGPGHEKLPTGWAQGPCRWGVFAFLCVWTLTAVRALLATVLTLTATLAHGVSFK